MAVEYSLVSLDYGVVSVNPHGPVIVQDGKHEDLAVQLFLALYRLEKYDECSEGDASFLTESELLHY